VIFWYLMTENLSLLLIFLGIIIVLIDIIRHIYRYKSGEHDSDRYSSKKHILLDLLTIGFAIIAISIL